MSFTYGYLREATLAHLDVDETEAQAMNILQRLHVFANEAMQAICASKPMYKYIDVTVVKEYEPLVVDNTAEGSFLRKATAEEIQRYNEDGDASGIVFANETLTKDYYNKLGIVKQFEKLAMSDDFIAFADKRAFKTIKKELNEYEVPYYRAKGDIIVRENDSIYAVQKLDANDNEDFGYISKNQLKFYKEGVYQIPAKYLWYRFQSNNSDNDNIDIPADIFLTIPLYIASICLEIDNIKKSQILRNQFETALARCTSTDFMPLKPIKSSW